MRTVEIPGILQELFGKEITLLELGLTLFTSAAISELLLTTTFKEWSSISGWRQILLVILTIDITVGVVGNFSYSTNQYYKSDVKVRLRFILFHIQPLILAFLLGRSYILRQQFCVNEREVYPPSNLQHKT